MKKYIAVGLLIVSIAAVQAGEMENRTDDLMDMPGFNKEKIQRLLTNDTNEEFLDAIAYKVSLDEVHLESHGYEDFKGGVSMKMEVFDGWGEAVGSVTYSARVKSDVEKGMARLEKYFEGDGYQIVYADLKSDSKS